MRPTVNIMIVVETSPSSAIRISEGTQELERSGREEGDDQRSITLQSKNEWDLTSEEITSTTANLSLNCNHLHCYHRRPQDFFPRVGKFTGIVMIFSEGYTFFLKKVDDLF